MYHKRYTELDGLRGVAAFTVFLSHANNLTNPVNSWAIAVTNSVLHAFWDGAAAVILFFILSGFVLMLPYCGESHIDPPSFIIKRVFRLYPAYIAAIALSLGLMTCVYQTDGLDVIGGWIGSFWRTFPSSKSLSDHLLLIGFYNTDVIDPVIWSLVIEAYMSLFFPIVILLLRWIKSPAVAVLAFLFTLFPAYQYMDMYLIARWAPLFVLGALLAIFRERLCRSIANLSKIARVLLAAFGVLLYSSRYSLPAFNFGNLFPIYLVGAGASIILLMTISDRRLQAVFRSSAAQFLGSISYSFYLVHLPILIAATSVVFPLTNSILFSCAVSLGFSFLFAVLIHKWIELPFQRIGKNLSEVSNNIWRHLFTQKS